MIGETAQLAVELKLKDQGFASSLARDEAGLKKLNSTVGKTGGAFSAVAGHVGSFQKNIGRAFNNVGKGAATAAKNIEKLAFVAGTLAVGAGVAAIKWAGEFEAQLNTINTIARETPEGLSKIGDTIRQIARDSGTPLEELTQGYYDLLSAGIKAADAPKVLAEANKLAIGGLASAAETVDLLTTAINVYGGDASQAAQFTDEFAKSIERGKVTAAELAGSYAQVAPLAKSLNIENKELAAGYATLTAAGTPAAEAATQMASAMTALLKTTPGLESLQKATKKNYAAIAGKQGLNEAFAQMRVDADKAGVKLVDLVGRKEALLYILQTTGPNQKKYNADLLAMGDAAGTAAAQMGERQKGLTYELKILKAGVHDAGIEIGSALLPKLTPLIGKLNDFLRGNREGIKKFGTDLANAFETVATWIGKIDFSQVATSLQLAGDFAKGLISAFLTAPQWLQTAVITGWGLNKLTGGAVQNVMADLTKAVIGGAMSQFIARGANPGNPLYVMDVSGGLGKGGPVTGGTLGKITSIASKVFLIGAAIGVFAELKGILDAQSAENRQTETDQQKTLSDFIKLGDREALQKSLDSLVALDKDMNDGLTPEKIAYQLNIDGVRDSVHTDMDRLRAALSTMDTSVISGFTGFRTDLKDSRINAWTGFRMDLVENAVARGTERGLVHSGVFKKAQTVREAGGFTTSREALIADLHTKAPLGVDALVTGQAIALAVGNHLRTDSNPDLKSAVYNLGLLRRLQAHLPADLAAKLAPKIASLEVAIDRATAAIKAIQVNQFTGFVTSPNSWEPTSTPRKGPTVNPSTGFVVNVNANISQRDSINGKNIKNRYGPTNTQAGAA